MVPGLPTPFGLSWDDVSLESLEAFLARGEDESLTWEAKGGNIRPEHVREAVCAFANSPIGGVLVLGVTRDREATGWRMDGWQPTHPEIGTWVDDALSNGGVAPRPSTSTKAWALPTGGWVACVAVWPAAIPPVMTSAGQVWVRTSGKSMKVVDPGEMRLLFDRGERARARAYLSSREAAAELEAIETVRGVPSVVIGMAAASLSSEMSAEVFRQSFLRAVDASVLDLHRRGMPAGLAALVRSRADWNQAGATLRSVDGFDGAEAHSIRIGRDGRVAVAYSDPDLGAAVRPPVDITRLQGLWPAPETSSCGWERSARCTSCAASLRRGARSKSLAGRMSSPTERWSSPG